MGLREFIKDNILVFDGAMGTMLQKEGLKLGENPEIFNIEESEKVKNVHKKYIENGAMVVTTNTFGANELKLDNTKYTVEEIIDAAISIAKGARENKGIYIALDIGPIGELLEPMGTLSFERAYDIFKRQMIQGEKSGADLILIETMTDLYEAKAALLAAKENTKLPVFCTMSFDESGRTFTGCTPESMALTLGGMGADAIGINCSLGPKELLPIVKRIKKATNLPIMTQPNAGLPKLSFGEAIYDIMPEEFKYWVNEFIKEGVSIIGGCCGTNPEFIKELRLLADSNKRLRRENIEFSAVCTPSKVVKIEGVKIIGERINPTGKKLFKEALKNNDIDYILKQAIEQVEAGAEILDVNVGLPEINEKEMMKKVVKEIQGIIDAPLQIDSSNIEAVEAGLRTYNGKPIVNSVNGEDEVLEKILPLVKKYGASVVGLTLDKKGIPATADERFKIAEKIVKKAKEYGIEKHDVFIDCLVLTASAQQAEVKETLKALRKVKEELGVKTLLGVSNISFGLPCRELINETFLAMAIANGLDLPIMNPNSTGMMDVINSYNVLTNIDKGCDRYISIYGNREIQSGVRYNSKGENKSDKNEETQSNNFDLRYIVIKGLKDEAEEATKNILESMNELDVVNEILIPSLDEVGLKYEKGEIFLPQLIQCAETVKKSFEVIKKNIVINKSENISKGKIVLATVKGDIHDIGKNIVKVILENYGYEIIDLGKDVPIETVVDAVLKNDIKLVGLSALMTTTLKSMKETIKALKDNGYSGKTFVGGAVLTSEYAKEICADYYAKDAKESVEIAKKILG
ncbi:homocysteine S-methyltransferase family protein [Clostridium botulinum]|uniref:homocysteine S-methyltransferase family protein n=1 Tax=Clostridium botulinum TaxID=1491 RepID=UPI000773D776|nr:homocysteine S-methyltransferase family protein [Clostridium botulinum]MBY6929073.1 homocysteine S-methyltransferase family protein [Clostridium botulinum]NFG21025.1 homocysteine methyltransferase [Clostridium botulinum]NFO81251.1 homocysteine methyltransferase [Clostridium botulinum]